MDDETISDRVVDALRDHESYLRCTLIVRSITRRAGREAKGDEPERAADACARALDCISRLHVAGVDNVLPMLLTEGHEAAVRDALEFHIGQLEVDLRVARAALERVPAPAGVPPPNGGADVR